jgi:hypothetical protein
MTDSDDKVSARLQLVGATDLERSLLDAAGREQPSRELSERMAQAIGVSLPASLPSGNGAGTEPAGPSGTETAAPNVTAPGAASSSLVPWIAGAMGALAVAGIFVVLRGEPMPADPVVRAPPAPPRVSSSVAVAPNATPPGEVRPAEPETRASAPSSPPSSRGRATAAESDLGDQIALLDAARAALAAGGAERALATVRDYQSRYPNGAFRPEAAAVKIEVLVKQGRTAEARAAAVRFVAAHGRTPLADRVARLAGLTQP